jgi:hypothetical protein
LILTTNEHEFKNNINVHLRAFACPARPVGSTNRTGVAPEDGTGAVKYDHRQKARFNFYIYNILMDLASILFPASQNYT